MIMKNSFLRISILVLFFAEVSLNTTKADDKTTTVTIEFTMPDNDGILISYVNEVLREVSKRTGINCVTASLPKKRALHSANMGVHDGVGARVKDLEREYPNLAMIGVPIITAQHTVFARDSEILRPVIDLKSLVEHVVLKDYVVGYLLGSKKAEEEVSTLPAMNKQYFLKPEKAFQLMDMGRLDAYIAGPAMANRVILNKNFPNSAVKEVAVISEFELFPYVHVKHASLIPMLEQALRSMTDEGALKRIRQSIEVE